MRRVPPAGRSWNATGGSNPYGYLGLGIAVVMYRGMPIMVRGRFATTAIPRDFLVDEIGTVTDPGDGEAPATVQVRDSQWRGRADTVLAVDDEIVVTGVDGLILEVAPRD